VLDEIVAAAASPHERRTATWLTPVGGDERAVDERFRAWALAAAGDAASFARLLAARGMSEADARAGLGTMRVVPGAQLPPWAEATGELLAAAARAPTARALYEQVAPGPLAARGGPLVADLVDAIVDKLIWLGGGILPDGPDWTEALRAHPALARVLGTVLVNLRAAALELCKRVDAEAEELGCTPTGCQSGAGDLHAGGRSVAIVECDGRPAFVLKPRDLRLGEALEAVGRCIGIELALPHRAQRDGYGWERFVRGEPLEGAALARDVGRWLRLADVLGGSDLFVGNVVAAGSRLVPLDVETAVGFDLVDPGTLPPAPAGSLTGLVTAPIVEPQGAASYDLGLFADSGLRPHVDELVEGFEEMHRALSARPSLEAIADAPARAVIRVTRVYDRLLARSLTADALVDGIERELVLERLFRATVVSGVRPEIVQAEVDDLRDLDIPRFQFLPGGRDLVTARGETIRDALAVAPVERIARRLAALPAAPDPADLDAVRTLAFCAAPEEVLEVPHVAPVRGDVDWRVEAAAAMDELTRALASDAGLAYLPDARVFALVPRRQDDLLSGNVGIALVLGRPLPERADRSLQLAGLRAPLDALQPDAAGRRATSLELLLRIEEEVVRGRDGDAKALARAERDARALLARKRTSGRWFPESHAADRYRLSAVWGLAAVAHVLRGLASPETFVSIRHGEAVELAPIPQ
jgi:hypothetical protein